jgi:hypothetical protein
MAVHSVCISALAWLCLALSPMGAPALAAEDKPVSKRQQVIDTFETLLTERCLPAMTADQPVSTTDLTRINEAAAEAFFRQEPGTAWHMGTHGVVLLVRDNVKTCQVVAFWANPIMLHAALEPRLLAEELGFTKVKSTEHIGTQRDRYETTTADGAQLIVNVTTNDRPQRGFMQAIATVSGVE